MLSTRPVLKLRRPVQDFFATQVQRRGIACGQTLVFHNLGQSLKDAGKYSEAIDAFRREQHLRPDLSAPLLAIAQCFHELGDVDSAAGEAIAASELDPSSTSAWNGAGWFLHLAGKSSAARDMLKRGLRLHPGNAAMYMHLGKALSDLGELGEAAAAPQHAACS